MPWIPEWLGRDGRPAHDLNSGEMDLYREEMDRVKAECVPLDSEKGHRYVWVWRKGVTAGSRLLTPAFAARQFAVESYPGCQLGLHPAYGMVVFWGDRVFVWPPATEEEVAEDATVGPFFAFGEPVADDDPRQVLANPDRDIVHETAGRLARAARAGGQFPPRTDGTYVWVLETTPRYTRVRKYPLFDPASRIKASDTGTPEEKRP